MVANIRSRPTPSGALYYNKEKVDKDEAEVLLWQKMLEPFDKHGRMDIDACMARFSILILKAFNSLMRCSNAAI